MSDLEIVTTSNFHTTDISVQVSFDGQVVTSLCCDGDQQILRHSFDDSDFQDHKVLIEMIGKTDRSDLCDFALTVSKFSLDRVDITDCVLNQELQYRHCYNGHSEWTCDVFSGVMGCDGQVIFEFSSPAYAWIKTHNRGRRWN